METQKIENFYLNESQLKKAPYQVYRVKRGNGRLYYTLEEGQPNFYISLTTLTRNTLPTSPYLIKWMCDMGYNESQAFMNERANYGSLMHLAFGYFLTTKQWNFDKTKEFIVNQVAIGAVEQCDADKYVNDLNDDVAAFAQFCADCKVNPIAIELVLVSKKDFYGTMIDLVCKMTVTEKGQFGEVYKTGENKGKPKESKVDREITALLNFKSGRKNFYDEHEIQLEFERRLFEENYPDVTIDKIYNWSPKEWTKTPTYNLKDQSESLEKEKADALLIIAKIELIKRIGGSERVYPENVKYGEVPIITEKSLVEQVMERHSTSDEILEVTEM